MGVQFLHAADLHLGSPLRAIGGASDAMRDRLARATQTSFRRIVDVALEREVDFVVVAGDLYDRESRSVRATQFLVEQFERLADADVPAYVVHGNHDPLGEGAEKLDLPDVVHVFGADEVGSAQYPTAGRPEARILGQSYGTRHESDSLSDDYTPPDTTVPTVGLLHTGLNPDGRKYAPCAPSDLAAKDVDYWALGHIHDTGEVAGAPAAYSGIPQGRHSEERGAGGCLVVDLEAGAAPSIEFVPTSPIVWEHRIVDVGADDHHAVQNLTDLEQYLEGSVLDLQKRDPADLITHDVPVADTDWEPDGVICRVTLTGRSSVTEILDDEATEHLTERLRDRLADLRPFLWTESVRDRVSPPLPPRETLIAEDRVIAELDALVEELRTDPGVRQELRGEAGDLWEQVDDRDREDVPADRLPLDDDRLEDLIDDARRTAIDELAVRRHHVD